MDLNRRLARSATRRVAVLPIEVPGWARVRCALQRELRARGWREATSAADADALVICGHPGAELARCVEVTWQQLPGPRARIPVTAPAGVGAALDQLLADLLDSGRQRTDAVQRPPDQTRAADGHNHGERDHEDDGGAAGGGGAERRGHVGMDHGGHGGMDHGGEHEGMDHRGHGAMDHGATDMPMPGGIPLADEGADRDGLDLDELHLPLGPVLPAWPAGLVVECALQGDLVTAAYAHVLPGETPVPADVGLVHGSPPDRLDRAARLLSVAGWEDAATVATRLRDRLLFDDAAQHSAPEVARLAARVRRSRTLRWSLADLPGVRDRLLAWFEEAHEALRGGPTPVTGTPVESLGDVLVGRELAATRLLVAAADVDTAGLVRSGADLS